MQKQRALEWLQNILFCRLAVEKPNTVLGRSACFLVNVWIQFPTGPAGTCPSALGLDFLELPLPFWLSDFRVLRPSISGASPQLVGGFGAEEKLMICLWFSRNSWALSFGLLYFSLVVLTSFLFPSFFLGEVCSFQLACCFYRKLGWIWGIQDGEGEG